MEEILASIRRIMADDEPPAPPRRPAGDRPTHNPSDEAPPRPSNGGPRQTEPRAEPMAEARAPRMPPGEDLRPVRNGPQRPAADPAAAGPRPRAPQPFVEDLDHLPGPVPPARPPRSAAPSGAHGQQEPPRRPLPEAARQDFDEPRQRPAQVMSSAEEAGGMFADIYAAAHRDAQADDLHATGPAPRRPIVSEEAPRAPRSAPRPPEGERDLHPRAPAQGREAEPHMPQPREDGARRRDLLSPNVDAVVAAAFQSLGDLVLPHKERTVEDLVKEILRPMLKDWLDKNLPGIVERLVKAEIERVSRQPR